MSFYFYRIDKLATEEELLRKKLKMENEIRKEREKKRHSKSVEGRKYSRMLEPVTKSLEELKAIQKHDPSDKNVIHKHDSSDENLISLEEFKERNPHDEDLIDLHDYDVSSELNKKDGEAGDQFREALNSIPFELRDDGMFGLNNETKEIGNNNFSVKGEILQVENKHTHVVKYFVINELDLWKLLLVKRPSSIKLNLSDIKGKQILNEYIGIMKDLDLVKDAERTRTSYKGRAKFKLIQKKGAGFLFSARPPPFVVPPSTVVIPSDKKGLLRALLRAVAELRAGNTSMQNIVVPLAHEAKRKKVLPRNLLSPDEMTWIFA